MNLVNFPECKHLNKIIFISTIYFSIFGIPSSRLFAQASLPEQNKYVLKSYMVIPWGDGKGQLPLKPYQFNDWQPDRVPEDEIVISEKEHVGPHFFKVDESGDVFVFDYDGKKTVTKKFNPQGNETASINISPDEFSIQTDKIVITSGNKIIFLNREDLSKIKEIDIPEEKYSLQHTLTLFLNGALYKPFEKDQFKLFVFDENARDQNPNDEKNSYYIKNGLLMSGGSEVMNLVKKFNEWTTEKIFNYQFIIKDKFGDFYLTDVETHDENIDYRHSDIIERTLFKFDPTGKLLYQLKSHREQFFSYGPISEHQLFVDRNGNIYSAWGDENGFHIEEYRYLNEKEKQ